MGMANYRTFCAYSCMVRVPYSNGGVNMKEKHIKLFDKTIHEVKGLINDIAEERKVHHTRIHIMLRRHDKKINKMIKKGLKLLEDAYELYATLSEDEGEEHVE